MSSSWTPELPMPTFHLLSQESPLRSRSRSRSLPISEYKKICVVPCESRSHTFETDPTWRFTKKYNCLVVEDTELGFSSKEGEDEEVTSVYDPTKMTCMDYFFMDNPPKRPSWLEPCGDELCPVCTMAGAARCERFAAERRPKLGSGLFRARRPLKNTQVTGGAGRVGRPSKPAACTSDADKGGSSFKSKGNKGRSIQGKESAGFGSGKGMKE